MKIHTRTIHQNTLLQVIRLVRKGKGLQGIPEETILDELRKFLEQHTKTAKLLSEKKILCSEKELAKKKEIKECIKAIRAVLRKKTGAFETLSFNEKAAYEIIKVLDEKTNREQSEGYEEDEVKRSIQKLLKKHQSTKERVSYQDAFIQFLYKDLKKSEHILDLGCGVMPLYTALLKTSEASKKDKRQSLNYTAIDISETLITFLNTFFTKQEKNTQKSQHTITGSAHVQDLAKGLTNDTRLEQTSFTKADRVFACKLFDLLKRKQAQTLMEAIEAPLWFVSFPTMTLTQKPMNIKRRGWFEKFLSIKGWNYELHEFPNELIYKITKPKKAQ